MMIACILSNGICPASVVSLAGDSWLYLEKVPETIVNQCIKRLQFSQRHKLIELA